VTAAPPAPPAPDAVAALVPGGTAAPPEPLAGDASNRRYFRVRAGDTSYVLMQMADPEGFKASEEAVTGAVPVDEPPFLNLQRYLKAGGCPVPEVVGVDLERGLVLLEDLGDLSLMAWLADAGEEAAFARYGEAVDRLVALQRDTPLDDGCVARHRTYTAELLEWEFDHFVEYGLEARLGNPLAPEARGLLAGHFASISAEIAAQAVTLVHRDYHSRNLMVRPDGSLGVIDFQDALMGPATYDLASLIWDPYVTLPEGLAEDLIARYRVQAPVPLGPDFPRALARTALQRLLKAAGRFVYIDRVKGNPAFLADVPRCLERAGAVLTADPELADLRALLGSLEPALGEA
jgi:aminoglycoside/choline kinase family phosphotransferase